MKRKKRKSVKLRGSHTHGYGSKKKHRGAGSRGGRGKAGMGKRADTRKQSINPKEYFGKSGFVPKTSKLIVPINLYELNFMVPKLETAGKIKKEKDVYVIDLKTLGYNKLLSKGNLDYKVNLKVEYATKKAIKKLETSGSSVEILASVQKVSEDNKEE